MSEIICNLRTARVSEQHRQTFYECAIEPFEDMDCDTLYECCEDDEVFDRVYRILRPELFEEE